jgi:hypothetical protein
MNAVSSPASASFDGGCHGGGGFQEEVTAVHDASATVKSSQGEATMWSGYSDDEKLLTKGEVARLCRVDIRTVDRWVLAGKVGCHRTPSGRVLFRKHDVLTVVAPTQVSPRDH